MKIGFLSLCSLAVLLSVVDAASPLNKDECVEWHNKYRKKHQAPDITWSASLTRDAQRWADYLAENNKFEHDSSRGSQGENLYGSSGDSAGSCRHATTAFYNEVKDYDYANPGFSKATGHFTQVVWVKSTELGVAKAERPGGGTVLVFRYSPSGNYGGQFAENVKPPISSISTPTSPTDATSPTRPTELTSATRPTSNHTTPTGSARSHGGASFLPTLALGLISTVLLHTLI